MAEDGRAGKPKFKPVPPTVDGEKTLVRDISFCGVPENGSNASMVDVKDGKIVRIRPMHYLWKYQEQELNPWKMTVRGSTFEPSLKTLLPPYSIALQETRVLAGPRPLSHEAGRLGPQRRAQPAKPRQEQIRAHLLG